MSTGLIEMRVQTPSTDVNERASDATQGQVTQSPATLASDDPTAPKPAPMAPRLSRSSAPAPRGRRSNR